MATQSVPAENDLTSAAERGVAFHQRGMLAEAEQHYLAILEARPDHFDALHLLGVLRQQHEHGGARQELAQHLPDQPRVTRVVLDQERTDRCLRTAHVTCGSVTIVNQKSSIDFTTVMNCSRSTGLVI